MSEASAHSSSAATPAASSSGAPVDDPLGFSSEWLRMRRDADARARTESTAALMRAMARPGRAKSHEPLDVIELGAGSGSNVLYLMPEFVQAGILHQRWLLVDRDEALLDEALVEIQEETRRIERALDITLQIEVEALTLDLATEMDDVPLHGAQLVTGSALLDLASGPWITDLASRLETYHVGACHMTLTVDGHVRWTPGEAQDDEMAAAFHEHMHRDKGFGPAEGPEAIRTFGRAMAARGATVQCFDASWILDDLDSDLQELYLNGVAEALRETDLDSKKVEEWIKRRRRWIDQDESDLTVGHYDILALRSSS